jgi:hypothetical protein
MPPVTAERFCFDGDAIRLVREMLDCESLSMRTIGEVARMPTDSVWMEYLDEEENARNGILVTKRPNDGRLLIALVIEFEGNVIPGMLIETREFPWRFDHEGDNEEAILLWEVTQVSKARTTQRASRLMVDALEMLFLLTVPRVCEVRSAVSRAERMRARKPRAHPPVEYKHVRLTVGVGSPRYQHQGRREDESSEAYAKRLHQVIGHFRTYRHEYGSRGARLRSEPFVQWIPAHWRGDAARGILLHNRDVGTDRRTR